MRVFIKEPIFLSQFNQHYYMSQQILVNPPNVDMNVYMKRMSKKAVLAYFMELLQNLTGGTGETHKKYGLRAEIRTGNCHNAKQWQITTTPQHAILQRTLNDAGCHGIKSVKCYHRLYDKDNSHQTTNYYRICRGYGCYQI
jgi:hypothetical protein